jgi:hypothetical protein
MASWLRNKVNMPPPEETLTISHKDAGFFSTCSIYFDRVIAYNNKYRKLPPMLNTVNLFNWYKPIDKETESVVSEYFENVGTPIKYKGPIYYENWFQFSDYKNIDYKSLEPYIKKYFTPSPNIMAILVNIETKYNIDYSNTCVLFFRGNDKVTEIPAVSYDKYLKKARELLAQNSQIRFLIQSDETEFIEAMSVLPNSFTFKDEIRHINKSLTTVDKVYKETNHIFSKNFLAIIVAMSKCKYVVCTTGNCSLWICLYRRDVTGVYQF